MENKLSKITLVILVVAMFMLTPSNKAFAGAEQIVIDLGADLISSLFGSSQNPQEIKIKQFEAKLTSNVKNDLEKAGFKVGEVKWDGMVKFADNLHVAFFSVTMNDKDGCYYYLLEKGQALNGNEPEDMKDYRAFLPMPITEKKRFLRILFEKYANFKIPDVNPAKIEPSQSY